MQHEGNEGEGDGQHLGSSRVKGRKGEAETRRLEWGVVGGFVGRGEAVWNEAA